MRLYTVLAGTIRELEMPTSTETEESIPEQRTEYNCYPFVHNY